MSQTSAPDTRPEYVDFDVQDFPGGWPPAWRLFWWPRTGR